MQNVTQRQVKLIRRQMVHIIKRLRAPVRARAQHKFKVIAEAKQLGLGIAVGDGHQRPLFGKLRQRVVGLLRHVDTAAPFGKVFHGRFGTDGRVLRAQASIEHRLLDRTTTPFGHVVVNVRLGFPQGLTELLKVLVLYRFQRGVVVLHKRQRLLLGTQDHLAVVIKGVIKVKRQS